MSRKYKVGDRYSRLVYLDDGTWQRFDDRVLPYSPIKHGVVIKCYRVKSSPTLGGYIDDVIDVKFEDGSVRQYLNV